MEGSNSPLYIIENQNEKNIDQILDINNENLSEKYNQNESTQNLNMVKPVNISSKEGQIPTNKGYVRFFRNIIKKKDKNRKKIIENRFSKWRKESLKGLKIKKTIIVRISVSREKDLKNKYKNKFNIEKEKDKSKSVNKNQIKTFNKNINNTKREIMNNNIDNKINDNIGHYEVAKKIKNYQGKKDSQNINKTNYHKINNTKIINNGNSKHQNKKVEINDEKPKITPKIEKNRNIYPMNNPNIQNYKPQVQENNTCLVPTPQKQYNNINIIFTSSTKKEKKDIPNNKNNNIKNVKSGYNLNNNNQQKNIQSTYSTNQSKGYHIKYEGYHKDKNKYTLMTPNQNNLNRQNNNNRKNEYDLYELNKNRHNIRKISDNIDNSFSQVNKADYNKYKRNTYQTNGRIAARNNGKNIIERYNQKDKNYTYSQNSAKSALKNGVTTVVQHYSGRRKQY